MLPLTCLLNQDCANVPCQLVRTFGVWTTCMSASGVVIVLILCPMDLFNVKSTLVQLGLEICTC